jgi:hypothetical protein
MNKKYVSKTYGILPMAGKGMRLQPIGFSKELYPVVYQGKHQAASELTIEAMISAGIDELKLVVGPDKIDIAKYYGNYSKAKVAMYFYDSPSRPDSCLHPIDALSDKYYDIGNIDMAVRINTLIQDIEATA